MNFKKKALSVLLAVAMLCNTGLNPMLAYATSVETPIVASTSCEHHITHTAECGYTEGTAGTPCTHTHTADCYSTELICGLTEEVVDSGSSSDAAHTHTQGCYKLVCTHVHDTACGYMEKTAGTPCTYECLICNPKDTLPPAPMAANAATAKANKGTNAITIKINDVVTEYGGATLEAAVTTSGAAANTITKLTITKGEVTATDWTWFKGNGTPVLSALTDFTVDAAVTAVADIPAGDYNKPIFPKTIVNITIPNAITIGYSAFFNCTALINASFPQATTIGGSAFNGCAKLTTESFTMATTIGDYAFNGCAMKTASFPKLTTIGGSAFYDCAALTSATFPMATTIGDYAFRNCVALASATFPVATTIKNNAFDGCTTLAELKLGATPPTVNADAFKNCPATRSLVLVNADGTTPLTGGALTTAQTEYDKVVSPDTGTATDKLWYGWTIPTPAVADAITIKINDVATEYGGATLEAAVTASSVAANTITKLTVTGGEVTAADWIYFAGGTPGTTTSPFTALTDFTVEAAVTAVADIPNGEHDKPIFPTTIKTVNISKATIIGNGAFNGCTSLTTASLPQATNIGISAFDACRNLASTSFPVAITIGNNAFSGCSALTSATFPLVKDIGGHAFSFCVSLATVSFPAAETIGMEAFSECRTLTTASFPMAIVIGSRAFNSCDALTTASFPGVTNIMSGAFNSCRNLTSTSFPVATLIQDNAFYFCAALTTVSFPRATTIGNNVFNGCTALAELKLGATPPTVGIDAFKNCPTSRSLVLVNADGTTPLTGGALTTAQTEYDKVVSPDTGTATDKLWYGWTILTPVVADAITIKINDVAAEYGGATLQAAVTASGTVASAITKLTITKGEVTAADWTWFKGSGRPVLSALTDFTVDAAVTAVADIPNGEHDKPIFPKTIVNVTIPKATTIGNFAFFSCTSLITAIIPQATSIGMFAFFGCAALATATFPQATTIGEAAFSSCDALTTATFLTATTIEMEAFSECRVLETASFPVATSISDGAFLICVALAELKLGATVPTTIGTEAFKNCPTTRNLVLVDANGTVLTGTALTNAQTEYDKVVSPDTGTATDGFWYGWKVREPIPDKITITVSDGTNTKTVGGVSLSDAITNSKLAVNTIKTLTVTGGEVTADDWIYFAGGTLGTTTSPFTTLTDFTVSDTVTAVADIPASGFGKPIFPTSIKTVNIPKVTTIGGNAFYNCIALATANFSVVTTIGEYAFFGCTALKTASFPVAKSIGDFAFSSCDALTSTSFPAATTIGKNAFLRCNSLTTASFPAATSIEYSTFDHCSNLKSASFPVATSIGGNAFSDCSALTSATFPKVTSIGREAFSGCRALTTARFPAATSIKYNAFQYCAALTNANFLMATSIGNFAFNGCAALTTASFPAATTIGMDAFLSCNSLATATFPAAKSIGDFAFNGCTALTSASFPVATGIGMFAFYDCTALTDLKLGATPPTVSTYGAFENCPAPRILVLVNSNGTPIVDGALITAQANYDAAEGNTTDKLWYGWKLLPQQATPTATIDYLTDSLKGLVGSAAYSITVGGVAGDISAKANGTLAIDSGWFGKTISIVKKGDDTTTADSTAQSLAIPAKPSAPTTTLQIAKTKNSIAITNMADYTGCEFSSDGSNWNITDTFSGLTQATAYNVSVRVKAVKNTSFASGSKSVSVTTIAADGSTTLKPNESIPTADGKGTITNDGNTAIIDNDKDPSTPNTVITPPIGGDVAINANGTVTVPAGGTVTTGTGPTVTLPSGGTADKDGNVSGGTGSVVIDGNTITPPAGGTITTDKDGKTELLGGSTIVNGDTTVKIDGGTSGGSIDKNGNITLPSGGEITVTDKGGNTSTIKVPATGGDVTVKNDGTVTAPGGSTVTPPGGKPPVTVPDGGGTVGGDGSIITVAPPTPVAPPAQSNNNNTTVIDHENNFWISVVALIQSAKKGDVLKIDTGAYSKMPACVMEELRIKGAGMIIKWNDGKDIVIPVGKALGAEKNRDIWTLTQLAEMYGKYTVNNKTNPNTGVESFGIVDNQTGVTTPIIGSIIDATTTQESQTGKYILVMVAGTLVAAVTVFGVCIWARKKEKEEE